VFPRVAAGLFIVFRLFTGLDSIFDKGRIP
jgi:hypothetical protein